MATFQMQGLRTFVVAGVCVLIVAVDPPAKACQDSTPGISDATAPVRAADTSRSPTSEPFALNPDRFISTANQSLLALLPGRDDAPAGFILENQSERSIQDVAALMGYPDEAIQVLAEWGWDGSVFRDFDQEENIEPRAGGTEFLNVSLHRFADAEAAASALNYFSDYAATAIGLQDQEAPALGETSRLLAGIPDGVAMALLYVQCDGFLYRIGASSADATGDPTGDLLEVARQLMTRYDEATPSPAP